MDPRPAGPSGPADGGPRFSSRLGLYLSVLGIAVGTGNIWRFPRIAAQNSGDDGSGAFLIAWVVCLLSWSIPLIVAEYALGQTGRRGVVGTFARLSGGRLTWAGGFVALVATAIMFYYAVVTGWCFYFAGQALLAPLPTTTDAARATWDGFQASGLPLLFHALAMSIGALVVARGVGSIERVSKVLLPALLGVVLLAVVRALTLPGAGAGVAFLFTPTWADLARPQVWLEALTQNAWDTGAGWGLILTYAAYMRREHGVVRNAVLTGLGNNTVSLLAATMVFSTVFAILGARGMGSAEILGVMQDSGPASTGLTFIWMPQLFDAMPLGRPLAVLFFVALSFAALTSLISMIELATRTLVDFGVARRKAVLAVAAVGFVLGVPSAAGFGVWDHLDVLGNQDFVWGVALMLSGALVAWLVVHFGTARLRAEVDQPSDWPLPAVWGGVIRWLVPLQAVVLLGWWMFLSATAYAPETWYDPFDPYSVMTCLVQWGVALAALLALNGWMSRRVARTDALDAAPVGDADRDGTFPTP